MKTRYKILLTIALASIAWFIAQKINGPDEVDQAPTLSVVKPALDENGLRLWYNGFNEEYFGDKLPKDTILGYDEQGVDNMATTTYLTSEKKFSVQMNLSYAKAHRIELYLLLHEMCHIQEWDESHRNGSLDEDIGHGPGWRACMLRIDSAGGFREIFIDKYKEKLQ